MGSVSSDSQMLSNGTTQNYAESIDSEVTYIPKATAVKWTIKRYIVGFVIDCLWF